MIPEWRIIDDALWLAVESRFSKQAPHRAMTRPAAKYALTGIARCGTCGGAIGCASTRTNGGFTKMYACRTNNQRGPRACPTTLRQPMHVVESGLLAFVRERVLTTETVEMVLAEVRRAAEAVMHGRPDDLAELEAELRDVRAEQKRLAKAVAMTDDVPELVSELKRRAQRAIHLEAQIEASKRAPEEVAKIMARIEASAAKQLADLRARLADPAELRQVLLSLFPEGLALSPGRHESRAVWEVREGEVTIPILPEEDSFLLHRDPKGT